MKRDGDEIVAFDRGDVVWGIDPFKSNDGGSGIVPRPWVVISDESVPFHPEQYRCVTLTSRTWHERSIPIDDDDWLEGGAPETSAILPWSVSAIKHDLLDTTGELVAAIDGGPSDGIKRSDGYQGCLKRSVLDDATNHLVGYLEGTLETAE